MTTHTYAIETSDDGLPNETPWKIWQIIDTGTENDASWAGEVAQEVMDTYLLDNGPITGYVVRVAVWDGPAPLEDIREAAAIVYAPQGG